MRYRTVDEDTLVKISNILKIDINELRYGWGNLPWELATDEVRLEIIETMSARAKHKFMRNLEMQYKRFPCEFCGTFLTKRTQSTHQIRYHKYPPTPLLNVSEI